jgi:FHS family L-fucose permease-like MFS transporter
MTTMATQQVTTGSTHLQTVLPITAPVSYTRPLAIVTTLFFMWGFLTSLNDILVPHLKSVFDLSYARVMLIQFAFFSAYFLFSLPWSKIVNAIGYQRTMVTGLLTMALGACLFVPAASLASFPLFLGALIVLAAGITGLQVAANPYVVVLGKEATASSRLNLTQAFNSLGTTIAPKLGGLLILSTAPLAIEELHSLSPQALQLYRVQQAASVKMPYIVIAAALVLLAVMIAMSKLPRIEGATCGPGTTVADSVWKHPNLILGALGIFAYVGAEVSIGSFLVNYFGQPDIAGFSPGKAAGYVSFYWGGAMIGRFLGAGLLRKM